MAAALYQRAPDAKKLGAFGLKASDYATKPLLVWPENADSVRTFIAMENRWHVGMSGKTSLNLSELDHIWRVVRVRRRLRRQILEDLLVMEPAALKEMHKKD